MYIHIYIYIYSAFYLIMGNHRDMIKLNPFNVPFPMCVNDNTDELDHLDQLENCMNHEAEFPK